MLQPEWSFELRRKNLYGEFNSQWTEGGTGRGAVAAPVCVTDLLAAKPRLEFRGSRVAPGRDCYS